MLYIVRHGETDWNREHRIQGHIDIPLNDQGKLDAANAKEKLKDVKFDVVFSSPLSRAIETAKIITDNEIIIDHRLIERYNGELEGCNDWDILKDIPWNEEKVIEYENKTSIKVNKLAIYNLEKSNKFYDRLDDRINVSAVKERPSGIAIYNYYTNRKLEYVEPDNNIYNEYFINKKSNNFSLDQVIVINDTIHWYLY